MIRKFTVTVEKTNEYIIEVDDEKLDKGLIANFERYIHNLGSEDKIKQLAKEVGENVMDNSNDFYEGLGCIERDGFKTSNGMVQGIKITTEYTDDYYTIIKENK